MWGATPWGGGYWGGLYTTLSRHFLSQASVEALVGGAGSVRVSQLASEVLVDRSGVHARVSQVAVEIAIPYYVPKSFQIINF